MPFSVLTPVTDVIIPATFYVDPLKGFLEGAPPKVPFPILFGTTVTTVLHYRADCDEQLLVTCNKGFTLSMTFVALSLVIILLSASVVKL